ncbi:MAG: PilZ domain-containing protein, partial [Gammaproteobacteria bacterium]|nr:PilZ domain-containing protein [Gammaproteobacteria bacterium]
MPGRFIIQVGENEYEFSQVSDVSVSGMGLSLAVAIEKDTEVVLRYESDDMGLALHGKIMWQSNAETDTHFRYGVQFAPEDADTNVMFFMALREYIDPFDEAI